MCAPLQQLQQRCLPLSAWLKLLMQSLQVLSLPPSTQSTWGWPQQSCQKEQVPNYQSLPLHLNAQEDRRKGLWGAGLPKLPEPAQQTV